MIGTAVINSSVLVLNQNYEPLNICRARRALVLLLRGKAEVLENNSNTIHGLAFSLPLPSVIRLIYLISRPRHQRRLTRSEVFLRDNYTCQYCGKQTEELTIDHVVPRHLGGEHVWENLVSACKSCNCRKAGRSPKMAGVKLRRLPTPPPPTNYYIAFHRFSSHPEWKKYVPQLQSYANIPPG